MRCFIRGVILGIIAFSAVIAKCEHKSNSSNTVVISEQSQYPIKAYDSDINDFKRQHAGFSMQSPYTHINTAMEQSVYHRLQMIALFEHVNSQEYKEKVIQAQEYEAYKQNQKAVQACLEQQAQEKLQKTKAAHHKDLVNMSNQSSEHLQSRVQALERTKQDGYKERVQTHLLDVQTQGMLQAHGIHHKQFQDVSGTIFQHQLFNEIATCYKKIAKIAFDYQIRNSLFVPAILDLGNVAFDVTKQQVFSFAMQLNDLADFMAESSLSCCKGVIGSACNFIDMYVLHPGQTAQQLTNIMVSVLHTVGAALHAMDNSPSYAQQLQSMQKAFDNDIQKFTQMCELSRQAYAQWYQHTSLQKKFETSSKCITDLILHPYLLGKASNALCKIISQSHGCRYIENLGSLAEELGAVEFMQDVAQVRNPEQALITTVGELEESMVSLFESESSKIVESAAKLTPKSTMTLKDLLKRLHAKGASYNDPQFQKEVLLHFNEQFCKKELLHNCQKAQELYEVVSVVEDGITKTLTCDLEHILTCNLKFKLNKSTGLIEGRVKGGHYGRVFESLKANNVIQVIEECALPCGGKGLAYKHKFGNTPEYKSIFSSSLSQEEIMQKILEVVEKKECLYFDTWFNGSKQKIHKIGQAADGAIIELFLLEVGKEGLFLESAFPYYEKYSKVKDLAWKK